MTPWTYFFFLLLLIIGVVVFITIRKIQRESYDPYYLKPLTIFFGVCGLALLGATVYFLIQL